MSSGKDASSELELLSLMMRGREVSAAVASEEGERAFAAKAFAEQSVSVICLIDSISPQGASESLSSMDIIVTGLAECFDVYEE